jgi:hypothetical protein
MLLESNRIYIGYRNDTIYMHESTDVNKIE